MSLSSCRKTIRFSLKKLGAAVALAMLFPQAEAAGWGDLTVLSALGQPLRAEIELVSEVPQDDGTLAVRLASFDAYRQANIEFSPALMSLRFAVEQRGNKRFVRITSTQPLNEPFVDMLLELGSNSGRVMREYVFLLDPADLGGAQGAVVAPVHGDIAPSSSRTAASNAAGDAKPTTPAAAKPAQQTSRAPAPPRPAKARPSNSPTATAPSVAKSRLTLTGVSAVSATDDKAGVIALEDYATMEKAVAESNARVKALEQKVADLQKLLEVTNSLLAELQKQNALAKAAGKPAAAEPAASVLTATQAKPAEPAVPAAPSVASAPALAPAAAPAPAPAPRKPAAPPAAQQDGDSYLLPGVAFLGTLLIAAGLYLARRRKAQQSFDAGLFPEHGDQAVQQAFHVDSTAASPGTGILVPGQGHPQELDVLAEADVYIAYGRDVQAEEILQEALRKQPERHAVRVKLLSIYAGRKDRRSFETFARELFGMTGGEGEDWKQAAAVGREIDPANPLYAALPQKEAAPAPAPEPELVLERIDGAPAAPSVPEASQDVALPDLAPAGEIFPPALETSSAEADFEADALASEALPAAIPVLPETETRDAGPGPIDFDFLQQAEPAMESAPTVPELPAAEPGAPEAGASLLDFNFVQPQEKTGAVPEIPPALLEEPTQASGQEEVLLDFDFLKPAEPAQQEEAPRKQALPNP